MLCGKSPFVAESEEQKDTFRRILKADSVLRFPEEVEEESPQAVDLIKRLLTVSMATRLGCAGKGIGEVAGHPFFAGTDWDALVAKTTKAPWVPELSGETDVSHFDAYDDDTEGPQVDPIPDDADMTWCDLF